MRIFDTFTQDVKIDILEAYVAYAKKDIADGNFHPGESVESIAVLYGANFLIALPDLGLIDLVPIVAWQGTKPPRPPRP